MKTEERIEWKSHCCDSKTKVVGCVTKYYVCNDCGKPCEPVKQIVNPSKKTINTTYYSSKRFTNPSKE